MYENKKRPLANIVADSGRDESSSKKPRFELSTVEMIQSISEERFPDEQLIQTIKEQLVHLMNQKPFNTHVVGLVLEKLVSDEHAFLLVQCSDLVVDLALKHHNKSFLEKLMSLGNFSAIEEPVDAMMAVLGYSSRQLTDACLDVLDMEMAQQIKHVNRLSEIKSLGFVVSKLDRSQMKRAKQASLEVVSGLLDVEPDVFQSLWSKFGGDSEELERNLMLRNPESLKNSLFSTLEALQQRLLQSPGTSAAVKLLAEKFVRWILVEREDSNSVLQGSINKELIEWTLVKFLHEWKAASPERNQLFDIFQDTLHRCKLSS
jgi:hypothetical protein